MYTFKHTLYFFIKVFFGGKMADDGLDGLDEGTDSSAPAKGNKAGGLLIRF